MVSEADVMPKGTPTGMENEDVERPAGADVDVGEDGSNGASRENPSESLEAVRGLVGGPRASGATSGGCVRHRQ